MLGPRAASRSRGCAAAWPVKAVRDRHVHRPPSCDEGSTLRRGSYFPQMKVRFASAKVRGRTRFGKEPSCRGQRRCCRICGLIWLAPHRPLEVHVGRRACFKLVSSMETSLARSPARSVPAVACATRSSNALTRSRTRHAWPATTRPPRVSSASSTSS